MTLENLVRINKLKSLETNKDEIARLLAAARCSVQDAQVKGLSDPSRFDLAYKAIMQCAMVAIRANGYRPSTNEPGHHATMIQSLPLTVGLSSERMVLLDALRKKRNLNDYNGDNVSEEETTTCVKAAESLLADVMVWLKNNHPELL